MLIKKYSAPTKNEAIMKAYDELGKDAVVMSIRTVSPKGIFKLFKKPVVEISAAVDDSPEKKNTANKVPVAPVNASLTTPLPEVKKPEEKSEEELLKARLKNIESLLEKQEKQKAEEKAEVKSETAKETTEEDKNFEYLKIIYNTLVDNEVDEKYANQIISEVEQTLKKDSPLPQILAAVYQKIILKLGPSRGFDIQPGATKFIFFIGPTGVGKTTTIAKLASDLVLNKKLKIALATSDTYRIAAVEQLTKYANILGIPLRTVIELSDMAEVREQFQDFDVVLVDTAGRSHRNREQRDDIEKLVNSIPEEEREIYLVLSVTTKYRDLLKITEAYSEISNYKLIFTKLDETGTIGNILNIRMFTGAPLSYSTFGQAVPDDIAKTDAQAITKQLLGGSD
jgi:flagellar biosynthesis protein FlhF